VGAVVFTRGAALETREALKTSVPRAIPILECPGGSDGPRLCHAILETPLSEEKPGRV
jgi:hypothetical protein